MINSNPFQIEAAEIAETKEKIENTVDETVEEKRQNLKKYYAFVEKCLICGKEFGMDNCYKRNPICPSCVTNRKLLKKTSEKN